MTKAKQRAGQLVPLDERFDLERGLESERFSRPAGIWLATDRADGEPYILWLSRKTGGAVDQDMANLLTDTVRRMRGVLARQTARDVLLEVIDIVEDDHEIGMRFAGADAALTGLSHRNRRRLKERARTLSGRAVTWRQIARLVRGLDELHSANIVHGGVSASAVYTVGLDPIELKLGGYEGGVHVSSVAGGSAALLRPGTVVSHAQDWRDLGEVAAGLFFQGSEEAPVLSPAEQRLLDRLCAPPQFAHVDGDGLATEIETLCSELGRVGSSGRYELSVLPGRDLLRRDVPSLTQGLISASDTDALLAFLQDDLTTGTPQAWRNPARPEEGIRIFTDRAVYELRVLSADNRIARITSCRLRGAGDGAAGAMPITAKLHLSRDPNDAHDRVARTGGGAASWEAVGLKEQTTDVLNDPVEWHALILIEIATLLEGRLRHYPARIVDAPADDLVRVAAREEPERDKWRAIFRMGEAAADLQREMQNDDGSSEWTLTSHESLSLGSAAPKLTLEDIVDEDGRRLYVFRRSGDLPLEDRVFLRPLPDRGTEASVRRRLRHVAAARGNLDLLHSLGDPRSVGLDPALRAMAPPGLAPADMDHSKAEAWESIRNGHALDLVIGPPGVGKTYLVSHLVGDILTRNPTARILISAQNHEALAEMERTLRNHFAVIAHQAITVRIERPAADLAESALRTGARSLLEEFILSESNPLSNRRRAIIRRVLANTQYQAKLDVESEAILRDTGHLILRSADIILATANSSIIEELVAEGQRFDWVILEEAARASAPELIGPLILGNRRLLIGDHRQLAPFDAARKSRLYQVEAFEALMAGAKETLESLSDLPEAVTSSLAAIEADPELRADVLAAALRLEQPFREIAEAAEEDSRARRPGPVSMLTEQSRMHPAICDLVSGTFYGGRLTTAERSMARPSPIIAATDALAAPVVIMDLPPLSRSRTKAYETYDRTSPSNRSEAMAVSQALERLRPAEGKTPSLVILSPYSAQCNLLRGQLSRQVSMEGGYLHGFRSPKSDGQFVHTIDSFQGGEADLVIISTVRNNQKTGRHALGILGDRRRMNVLLSRARHKLVLVTSMQFLRNATRPETGLKSTTDLDFVSGLLGRIEHMAKPGSSDMPTAAIIRCDEKGRVSK